MEFIKQVLLLANKQCKERYSSSIYRLCGMDENNENILIELMAMDKLGPLLEQGSLAFLRIIPSLGWTISAAMLGSANSIQTEKLIKKVYENPLLYKACSTIKEKYRNNDNNVNAAADELLRIIELESML